MTSQQIMRTKAQDGMCWYNVSAVDETPDWQQIPNPRGPMGDPNYGLGRLFGYDQAEFLARQYK